MYEYRDFSKSDRKQFQDLVSISVKNEISAFLKKMLPIHQSIVETTHEDIRKPYWELNDSFKNFSKHLTRQYDGYSHRDLPTKVTGFLLNGYLNEDDFAGFSEDGKPKLSEMRNNQKKWRE